MTDHVSDKMYAPDRKLQEMWDQLLSFIPDQKTAKILDFVHDELVRVKQSEAFMAGIEGRRYLALYLKNEEKK